MVTHPQHSSASVWSDLQLPLTPQDDTFIIYECCLRPDNQEELQTMFQVSKPILYKTPQASKEGMI